MNLGFRLYCRLLIQENKWRAVRYGLDGKLIDFGKQVEVPVKDLIHELIQFVDDVVDEMGSRKEINHVYNILVMEPVPIVSFESIMKLEIYVAS